MSIELTIDGKTIHGNPGQTILQVAEENGIAIPTLCHHPRLPITGSCRICVVDVGRPDRLEAACAMPISKGMVVRTNTERVIKARRMNLELLLSNHKIDCLTCERNGNCALQDLAYEFEIELDQILFEAEDRQMPVDDSSPVITFNPNKCILCGRCVSACNEVQNHGILNFEHRGYHAIVIAGLGKLLIDSGCVSCGECVQVCPTGALTEKMARFKGRWWELNKVTTVCPYCGVGCAIDLYVKDNRIIKVRGNEEGVENKGSLCVKGRFGFDYVNSMERLTTPLLKRDGKFEEISWDEALDLVASKFLALKEAYGPDSLAGLASAKCTNEENYLFQKLVRTCFGNNNVDHCARLCHAPTVVGLVQAFGSGAMTNSIAELLNAEVIFVTGSNTTENHPIIAMYILQAVHDHGAKLIVADPRKIDLVDHATLWLQQQSGTDVALFNGLMNVILEEELWDREFVESRCENFDAFVDCVKTYTPERVAGITNVPAENIREAARVYAGAERAAIIFSMGITQHTTGTDNVLTMANLAMLTGHVGRASTGVNPLRGQNNVQGACDLGALPDVYPGYQRVADEQVQQKFQSAWAVPLDDAAGLTVVEIMRAAEAGTIKGLYIMGENPMLSDPNITHVKEALEKLEFLVVQDIFLSETAQLADLVLPGTSFAEKEGTFTNTARRIQRIHKAISPIGQSREDWRIICQIAQKMGYPMTYQSPAEIMDEIAQVTPIYGGVHYDRLNNDGLQWPCTDGNHPGTPYLHKNTFSRGKGHFTPVEYLAPAELPDAEYPFTLTTGRLLQHFHTGTMTRRAQGLDALVRECQVEINPEDARLLGITSGDVVKVTSRRGVIQAKAKVTERSAQGLIFIPFHFKEAPANMLTNDALDPKSKIPEFKVAAVRVEKVAPDDKPLILG
jgi:formate dehydrogenase alpha subunit